MAQVGSIASARQLPGVNVSEGADTVLTLAADHFNAGRCTTAIELLEPLVQRLPEAPEPLRLLAQCYCLVDRERAIPILKRYAQLRPTDPFAVYQLGKCYLRLRRDDLAEAYFQLGLDIVAEDDVTFAMALCRMAELRCDHAEARGWLDRMLHAAPANPQVGLAHARALRREGQTGEAIATAEQARTRGPGPAVGQQIDYLLGKLYEEAGEYDASFAAFVRANDSALNTTPGARARNRRFIDRARQFAPHFDRQTCSRWRGALEATPCGIAWQVGFPRSGTTMLNRMIDAHPQATVFEELNFADVIVSRLQETDEGYPACLASMSDETALALRERYLKALASEAGGLVPGHLYVDKNPLNTLHLGLAARLFPEARILMSLRHPVDVALSCYMQSFTQNEAMSCFLSLDDTVALYGVVMHLYEHYCDVLELPSMTVRYEDLVRDPNTYAAQVLAFLGLPWDDGVLAFHRNAGAQRVRTASFDQVSQPLYTRAMDRWSHYREHLAPWLPALAPWAERFGYDLAQ